MVLGYDEAMTEQRTGNRAKRVPRASPRHDPIPRRRGPLPMPVPVQVTRSARILYWLSAAFFSVALVALFVLGAVALLRGMTAIGLLHLYAPAVIVYALLFGLVCSKARI